MAMLVCTGLVNAQWMPMDVVPAQRGEMPVVDQSTLPVEPAVRPLTLWLSKVTAWTVDAVPDIYVELSCSFSTEEYGANSMSLEERLEGQENWTVHTSNIRGGVSVVLKSTREYRLKLNDGPRQGECSNVVKAEMPTLFTKFNGYTDGRDENALVNEPIQATIDLRMRALDYHGGSSYDKSQYTDYDDSNNYFRYRWYLMNPYTYEMKPIEGANERYSTPTMADLGYMLVQRISGDNVHCSFDIYEMYGVVEMAVQVSLKAAADDGFIVNTNYDVPESKLVLYSYDSEQSEFTAVPTQVTKRKAGQYAINCDAENYLNSVLDFTDDVKGQGYKLWMRMERMGYGGNSYREMYLEEYLVKMPLVVGAKFGENVLPTTLELYSRNLFGDGYSLAQSAELIADAEDGVVNFEPLFKNEYLLLAKGTEATDPTYYPNVVFQNQATPIEVSFQNWFNPEPLIIEAQPIGTIEASVEQLRIATTSQRFFSIDGRQGRVRGLNLVRLSDGSVRKVMIRK